MFTFRVLSSDVSFPSTWTPHYNTPKTYLRDHVNMGVQTRAMVGYVTGGWKKCRIKKKNSLSWHHEVSLYFTMMPPKLVAGPRRGRPCKGFSIPVCSSECPDIKLQGLSLALRSHYQFQAYHWMMDDR